MLSMDVFNHRGAIWRQGEANAQVCCVTTGYRSHGLYQNSRSYFCIRSTSFSMWFELFCINILKQFSLNILSWTKMVGPFYNLQALGSFWLLNLTKLSLSVSLFLFPFTSSKCLLSPTAKPHLCLNTIQH